MDNYKTLQSLLFLDKIHPKSFINFPIFFDRNEFYLNYSSFNKLSEGFYWLNHHLNEDYNSNAHNLRGEYSLTRFNFFKNSTIKSFFNSHMVDIPICFRKSKSLYNKSFELPLLKLSNMIMRKGLHSKVINTIGSTVFTFINLYQKTLTNPETFKWINIHTVLDLSYFNLNSRIYSNQISDENPLHLFYNNKLYQKGVDFHLKSSFNFIFFESIKNYLPVFSFFVRKVDKSVRKNSRGKSGKYIIIWKYVPTYKRLYTTLRWFIKDLKFQKSKNFKSRFLKILETFILNPKVSFLVKLRRFVHIYVFENLKNKLMKNLKTTS